MRLLSGVFVLILVLFAGGSAFADSSSTNYAVASDGFSGGGSLSVTSTNYAVEDSFIEWTAGGSFTSTNYAVDGKAGIGGVNTITVIQSVSPSEFSRFYTDQSASFTVTAVDPDSDTLQYQAKQDSTLKDGPQASSTLDWTLSGTDKGRHAIYLQVLDPDGTVSKTQAMYVYRRPIK